MDLCKLGIDFQQGTPGSHGETLVMTYPGVLSMSARMRCKLGTGFGDRFEASQARRT
jgi:hypothetical protein